MRQYFNRFSRAAKLDAEFYREIAANPKMLNQAWITVLLYCMLSSWGSFGRIGAVGSHIAMITTLIGWYIWAFFTYFVATRFLLGTPAEIKRGDRKTVFRVMGFATAPGVIRLLGIIPGLGIVVFVVASIWMIVASTLAVKQALDIENTARAAGACIIGWIISALVQGTLNFTLFSSFKVSPP